MSATISPKRVLLRLGGVEGQHLAQRRAHRIIGFEGNALPLAKFLPLQLQAQFEVEELFENQPLLRRRSPGLELAHRGSRLGKVRPAQCVFAAGQLQTAAQRLGQGFGDAALQFFQQPPDDPPLPTRGQFVAQGLVDRRDAAHLQQLGLVIVVVVGQHFHLRLDHFEAVAAAGGFHFSVQGHPLAGFEAVFQIGPVKPHALDLAQALADGHFKDGHAPGAQQRHAAHLADQAGHFAGDQFLDGLRTEAVLIAEGQVVEQVFDGGDALVLQRLGDARADALDELQRRFQSQ